MLIGSDPQEAARLSQSLAKKIKSCSDLELKSDVYHALGLAHHTTRQFDKAFNWYEQALVLRRQGQNKKGQALTLNNIGLVFYDTGRYSNSIKYFNDAIELKLGLKEYKSLTATYANLGASYERLYEYKKAMEIYYKSLRISEELGDRARAALTYQNMGNIYHLQGSIRYALRLYKKARNLHANTDDKIALVNLEINIALSLLELKKYNEALNYYQRCLTISTAIDYRRGILAATNNIGIIMKFTGRHEEALVTFQKCLQMAIAENEFDSQCDALVNISGILLVIKNYDEAKCYLRKAMQMARKTRAKHRVAEVNLLFSELFEALEEPAKALRHHKQYHKLNSSINNSKNANQINQLQTQYEVAKKDEEVKTAKLLHVEAKLKNQQARNEILQQQKDLEIEHLRNVELKKERDRSEGLLLNILPAEVAEELKEKGTARAKQFDNVTVLFTDFKDFTKVSERLSPQQLVDELHACFSAFDAIIEKHNIEKIKTVGDAYLAVSGLPLQDLRHAENILKAAMEIRDFMLQRKLESKRRKSETFEIRIGIHSGSVVAGIVGVKKFAYDIWGDTVNTAARMEQNSEAGKINISQSTYRLVKSKFNCEYRGEIEAKNKGRLKMYFVV